MSDITEQISKIAPQRPGLQCGYHGYPTTAANNSLSSPNLVQLELFQREDGGMEKMEDREGEKESKSKITLCFHECTGRREGRHKCWTVPSPPAEGCWRNPPLRLKKINK